MGRDKKSKKSNLTIISKIFAIVLSPVIYELIVHHLAKQSLGSQWEVMLNQNLETSQIIEYLSNNFWCWFSLVLCRIVIYLLPAILFYIFSLFNKRDKRKSQLKTFIICLNWQFLGYLIYQCLTTFLALDYLIGLEPFSNISIYISLFGFIATLTRNKDVEFGKISDKV